MRVRTITAFVAAVLSSGSLSPLGAQRPSKPDTTRGFIGASKADVDQLTQLVDALRKRVSALESELAKLDRSGSKSDAGGAKMGQKFQAPFTVVDENGKMIFTVSDDDYNSAFRGRVHIGPGSGGNYNLWFHTASGVASAAIGESRGGSGFISVLKGGKDAALMHVEGFELLGPAKPLVHLGLDPKDKSRARLVLRGPVVLTDPAGNTIVDAGATDVGEGAVRAYPNANCRPGLLATCIRGAK